MFYCVSRQNIRTGAEKKLRAKKSTALQILGVSALLWLQGTLSAVSAEEKNVTRAGYEPMKPVGSMPGWFYKNSRAFRYPVPAEFEFAYIDKTGEVVIAGPFCVAGDFKGGVAPVEIGSYDFENGKWSIGNIRYQHGAVGRRCLMTPDGKTFRANFYQNLPTFYDDVATAFVKVRKQGEDRPSHEPGLIDKSGTAVLSEKWQEAGEFSEGTVPVRMQDEIGRVTYVDREAKPIFTRTFVEGERFSEGLAAVADAGSGVNGMMARFMSKLEFFYIDKTGKTVISGPFKKASAFADGLAAVESTGGKWGYVDKTGKVIVPYQYDWCGDFSDGLAPVEKDMLVGFVDKTGKVVIPLKFKDAKAFSEELAPATLDGRCWGFIDRTGKFAIQPLYQRAFPFGSGRALVYTDIRKEVKLSKADLIGFVESIYSLRSDGQLNEARRVCNQIIQSAPGSTAAKTAKMHLDTGLPDHDVPEGALALYREAVELAQSGELSEAEVKLSAAIKADPEVTVFYGALAYIYIEQKKYPEIAAILENLLSKHKQYARGYWRLSQIQSAMGNADEASKSMAVAKELDPDDPYFVD